MGEPLFRSGVSVKKIARFIAVAALATGFAVAGATYVGSAQVNTSTAAIGADNDCCNH
jgi:hypothetical protein